MPYHNLKEPGHLSNREKDKLDREFKEEDTERDK